MTDTGLPTLELRVPDGAQAGQWLQLNTSGGPTNVKVPAGVGPGGTISVQVPIKPPADGTPLRLADPSAWPAVKDISERIIPIEATEINLHAMLETQRLVSLMPADLQAASMPEYGEHHDASGRLIKSFEKREDCEAVLAELTRAIPMKMLFDHGEKSLHRADDKAKLRAFHFFLSTQVSKLRGFVSHRWNADPRETADALMLHFKLRFLLLAMIVMWILTYALFLIFPPATVVAGPLLIPAAVAIISTKNERVLRRIGCTEKAYWFDKATVHQTENCLTQAGLHLFGYYLEKSDQLVILFLPVYLTRVWCVYELAYWLKHEAHKPGKAIVFVPLETNAAALRVLVRLWPIFSTVICFFFGIFLAFGTAFSRGISEHGDVAQYGQFYLVFMPVVGLLEILVAGIGIVSVVLEARRQRLQVAATLKKFDVKETQAFSKDDKTYVLGEIKKWWAPDKEEEDKNNTVKAIRQVEPQEAEKDCAALRAFNDEVKTKVASHLDCLQRWREVEITCLFLLLMIPWIGLFPLVFEIGANRLSPLFWPTMISDLELFLTPDDCYCEFMRSTSSSENISKTCISYAASAGSGEVPAADRTCFMFWDFGAGMMMSILYLFLLIVILALCYRSMRWAGRATGTPEYRSGMGRCFGVAGLVGSAVCAVGAGQAWIPAGVGAGVGCMLLTLVVVALVSGNGGLFANSGGFAMGEQVRHRIHGLGTIIAHPDCPEAELIKDGRLRVKFDGDSRCALSELIKLKFAVGERVRHQEHGSGTVEQWDLSKGLHVRVKYDRADVGEQTSKPSALTKNQEGSSNKVSPEADTEGS